MTKLWATLAALLGLLSAVMAQNASTTVASILPATTTSMPPSPTPTPSSSSSPPSPSPTPNPHPEEAFYVFNKEGMVCAHVESVFTFSIKYSVDGKDRSVDISLNSTFVPHVDTDESKCEKSRIVMAVKFNTSEADHFLYLEFTNKSKEYSLASLNASLDLSDNKTFPDFNTTGTSGAVNVSYDEKVFTVDNKKSYKCKSGKSYRLKPEETVPDLESVYLRTYQFRAQAFKFSNDTTGDFDKSVSCSLDQKSSKVVPIAVGAALAGLVIVVLIAYLIGRFRSRKQNSYEALS